MKRLSLVFFALGLTGLLSTGVVPIAVAQARSEKIFTLDVACNGRTLAPPISPVPRGDVAAVYPGVGDLHGFNYTVTKPLGVYSVCVHAVNQGWGADRLIGCQTATVR